MAPGSERLRPWDRAALGVFLAAVVGLVVMTEIRSCFLTDRHTDFGVYLRAAWAAREGHDMYAVVDDNGWHYCYPPTFALFLAPLADPPAGPPRGGYVPFWAAVGVWTVLCVAFAFAAAHVMAKAVVTDAPRGSRRWWYARTVPVYATLGGIGFTVSHGQVNTLVALLTAGVFVSWAAKRSFASGVWLAGSVAVKVIPGLLLLFALVHRDRRAAAGFVVGSVVLLGVVPAVWFGPAGAVRENRKFVELVLAPGATGGGDQTRAEELTSVIATDSHSFLVVIHNIRNPGVHPRPAELAPSTRVAHWVLSFLLLAVTLRIGLKHRAAPAADQGVFLGALVLVMLLMTPASHQHYFAMALPAAAGLWLKGLADRPGQLYPSPRVWVPLVVFAAGTALPLFPGDFFRQVREYGLGTAATLVLWAASVSAVGRDTAALRVRPGRGKLFLPPTVRSPREVPMRCRQFICLPLLFAASLVLAQDKKDPPKGDDPIAQQLAKDKEAYAAATEKAREGMLAGFDKYFTAVKNSKTLKIDAQVTLLEKIEAEKKAFEESAVPPALPGLKDALAYYRAAQKKADAAGKAAFEKAAKAYKDMGNVKAAGDTLDEWKELQAKAGAALTAYTITAAHSSKVVGLGGKNSEGTRLVTADYAKGDQSQLWRSIKSDDGYFYIQNVKTGLFATLPEGAQDIVVAAKKASGAGQLWKSVPLTIPDAKGAVKLTLKGGTRLMAVDGGSKNANARIIIWSDENDSSQWFGLFPPK